MCRIATLLMWILLTTATAWSQNRLPPAQVAEGELVLFDGSTLTGWDDAVGWQTQAGMLSAPMGLDHHIMSALPFGDFTLSFDFRLSATPSGAAVRIRAPHSGEPMNGDTIINLGDAETDWPSGSIVKRAKAAHTYLPQNVWHTVSIDAVGDTVTVQIDGQQTAQSTKTAASGGYLEFESTQGSQLDLRSIYLRPKHLDAVFNGADLNGWKSVPASPKNGTAMGHSVEKMLTLGMAGGPDKPHSAKWTVRGGALHGEDGPGVLESTATYGNFVLQVNATLQATTHSGKEQGTALVIRDEAARPGAGYALGLGSASGVVYGLAAPRRPPSATTLMSETIVAGDRGIGIFGNGQLMTLYYDTRPEGSSAREGSKLKAGSLGLVLAPDNKSIDVHSLAIEALPSIAGVAPPAVASPIEAPLVSAAPAASTPEVTAQTAQIAAALGTEPPQTRRRVAQLMSGALRSNDPQKQMQLYDQVVQLEPANAAAVQGYKDASAKAVMNQQQQVAVQQQVVSTSARSGQATTALVVAQTAFLAGHLRDANTSLQVAERLAPGNPATRDLRSRLNGASNLRSRMLLFGSGAGLLSLAGLAGMFWHHRRQRQVPMLRVIQGLDKGQKYALEQSVVHLGGIAKDGAQRNEIVVRDVEHMISRFHCEFHRQAETFYIVDKSSANGTRLGGRLIPSEQPVPLRRGAKIEIGGSTIMQFYLERKRATPRMQRS